jgi:hypothetical protein
MLSYNLPTIMADTFLPLLHYKVFTPCLDNEQSSGAAERKEMVTLGRERRHRRSEYVRIIV